jgi:hypothetical protein
MNLTLVRFVAAAYPSSHLFLSGFRPSWGGASKLAHFEIRDKLITGLLRCMHNGHHFEFNLDVFDHIYIILITNQIKNNYLKKSIYSNRIIVISASHFSPPHTNHQRKRT